MDNAPIESFFGHMNDELDYKDYQIFQSLQRMIEEYNYDPLSVDTKKDISDTMPKPSFKYLY
ncbi:hypothetical protein [Bacillus gaemokensis]|uniref:Integrase catalytic domain-containing protein n=1 Tax=Bacillus gaemokensis TaxID=574375 RepID=A0A073KQR0_9BACI|nr:hypothetical protein [Bacillus gaemokensis]KEK24738.1 hypothetical protein BAGA_24085 [Bacillus gaemokensis]KYG34560.1 hypothetical protein AZF08_09190 [Bacillus gaemokensis]